MARYLPELKRCLRESSFLTGSASLEKLPNCANRDVVETNINSRFRWSVPWRCRRDRSRSLRRTSRHFDSRARATRISSNKPKERLILVTKGSWALGTRMRATWSKSRSLITLKSSLASFHFQQISLSGS